MAKLLTREEEEAEGFAIFLLIVFVLPLIKVLEIIYLGLSRIAQLLS